MKAVPAPLPAVQRNLQALRQLTRITPFIVDGDARSTMLALIDDTLAQLGAQHVPIGISTAAAPAECEAR